MNNLNITVEKITPQIAHQYLLANTNNRQISKGKIALLVNAMKSGDWTLNGDAIRFASTGTLLDGQHRLTAIAQSGITCESIVIRNLDKDVFDTIDQGTKRTNADVLSVTGIKNSGLVATVARLIWLHEKNGIPWDTTASSRPTVRDIEHIVNFKYPEIISIANNYKNPKSSGLFIPSEIVYCKTLIGRSYPDKSETFFETMLSGSLLNADDPILLLRNKMIDEKFRGVKNSKVVRLCMIFKVFKLHLTGQTRRLLRVSSNDFTPEAMREAFSLPHLKNG